MPAMDDDKILMLRMLRQQAIAIQCCLDTLVTLVDAMEADSTFTVTPKESAAETALPDGKGPVTDAAPGLDLPKVFGGKTAGASKPFEMPPAGPDGVIGDQSPPVQ